LNDAKFDQDLLNLLRAITEGESQSAVGKLERIRSDLVRLHAQNLVKINHSVMELLCAKHLIVKGYDVFVEHHLSDLLVCDLYGTKGDGRAIVEVETGFVPPEHALDPSGYLRARTVSKIARYSTFSDKFTLGTPPYSLLSIYSMFQRPPRYRSREEIDEVKRLCDKYYMNPPITAKEIAEARLHSIFLIDVDRLCVREVDPDAYADIVLNAAGLT